ncbi:MAG TPA: diguanylate cyclase, partial [Spirochaetota bacterium]|nr:diguanylate cyclase [Spirochaetota bacterium]
ILEEIQNRDVVVDIGNRILAAIGEPVRVDDYDVSVTGSIGIALWPADAEDSGELLVRADRAMYVAKRGGKNTMTFSG